MALNRLTAAERNQLVLDHAFVAKRIARRYRKWGLDSDDIEQAALERMLRISESFDPDRGTPFGAYAEIYVKKFIWRYVMRNSSIVRLPSSAARDKVFSAAGPVRRRLDRETGGRLSDDEMDRRVAAEIGVSLEILRDTEARVAVSGRDWSLNLTLGSDDGDSDSYQDRLVDEDAEDTEIATIRRIDGQRLARRIAAIVAADNNPMRRRAVMGRLEPEPEVFSSIGADIGRTANRAQQLAADGIDRIRDATKKEFAAYA